MLFAEHTAVLSGCLELLSAISGMERENITRGPGWLFIAIGRRLERAMFSVAQLRLLQSHSPPTGGRYWNTCSRLPTAP